MNVDRSEIEFRLRVELKIDQAFVEAFELDDSPYRNVWEKLIEARTQIALFQNAIRSAEEKGTLYYKNRDMKWSGAKAIIDEINKLLPVRTWDPVTEQVPALIAKQESPPRWIYDMVNEWFEKLPQPPIAELVWECMLKDRLIEKERHATNSY